MGLALVVTVVAAVPVLAAMAELAARWWIRHRNLYYVFTPGSRLHLRPDSSVYPQLEPLVRFEINADGERGETVPRCGRRTRLYRVLVAGGSQPEGYSLDQPTSWPGALQRLLQTPAHLKQLGVSKVHVGNIARSGVDSQALDLILERVLPRYRRLDAIIIVVGGSDVLHWLEQGASSRTTPVGVSQIFKIHPEGQFGWKPGTLALVELLRRLRQRWLRPIQLHVRAGKWVGRARAMRARAKDIRTTMPQPDPMLDRFETHLRRLLQRAKAHADRVLLVRQSWFDKEYSPEEAAHMWHGAVGEPWREEVATYYSFDVVSRLMSLLDARAARVATELDVEQLELMPLLEPSLKNYYDWLHLTAAGARVVTRAVGAAILRQPLVSIRGRGRSEETVALDRPRGVVASMQSTDGLRRRVS